MNLDDLCRQVASGNTPFDRAELKAAVEQVLEGVREHLADGKTVDISGLGAFRLSLGTEGDVTASSRQRLNKIKVVGVNFRVSPELLLEIGRPTFRCASEDNGRQTLTTEELVPLLKEYFSSHDSITREAFERVFHFKRSTAAYRLKELVEQGILKAEGDNRSRIYRLGL